MGVLLVSNDCGGLFACCCCCCLAIGSGVCGNELVIRLEQLVAAEALLPIILPCPKYFFSTFVVRLLIRLTALFNRSPDALFLMLAPRSCSGTAVG